MTVLGIDTASRRRIVCVLAGRTTGVIRRVVKEDVDLDRALPPLLQSLLADGATEVAVVTGPGSYTGVRSGMAAAVGIAHARGLPLFGITSLDPVWLAARAGGATDGLALADAGRGGVYAMPFTSGRRSTGDGGWARIELAHLESNGLDLYSSDPLPIDGLHRVDPAMGLALAVTGSPSRPLRLDALQAEYDRPA